MMTRTQFLLIKIAEECNEIAQCALKAAQFGLDAKDPRPEQNPLGHTDGKHLLIECADLAAIMELFAFETGLGPDSETQFDEWIATKKGRVEKYYQIARNLGQIE